MRMPFTRSFGPLLALGSGLALLASAACFIEPGEPPGFLYECSADDQCAENEQCIASLCQTPCTVNTFAEDCPQDGSAITCFNGVCASSCDAEANDPCPGELSCISFDLYDFGEEDLAICGHACDEADAPPCPDAEICLEGVCLPEDPTGETGGTTGGYQ